MWEIYKSTSLLAKGFDKLGSKSHAFNHVNVEIELLPFPSLNRLLVFRMNMPSRYNLIFSILRRHMHIEYRGQDKNHFGSFLKEFVKSTNSLLCGMEGTQIQMQKTGFHIFTHNEAYRACAWFSEE